MIPPSNMNLAEPYAEYHSTNVLDGGVLTTTRQFVIKANEVALDQWEAFRKFGKAIADDEYNLARLNGVDADIKDKPENGKDAENSEDADELFRSGTQALQWRDFNKAQKLFEKVIAKDPKHTGAHFNLGIALAAQSKFIDALSEFRKEEEISPADPRSYSMAASVANFGGRKDDAMEEWRKLLKLDPENHDAAMSLSQLLYQAARYPEAAEVLEAAVKASPNDARLEYALGSTYLKAGQSEKAVSHMRAAVEVKSDDAMMLNNVAYALSEDKTNVELSRQYAEAALKVLDARSADDAVAMDRGTQVTYQFSLVWDTMGWVYFQSGDVSRAENFVHASWMLGQDPIVGEHLGEIYEKQGKSKDAAHVYELALAAVGTPLYGLSGTPPAYAGMPVASPAEINRQGLASKIASHFQKLTGKKPAINETWRLPNGEWTKSASEQLTQMRTAKFGKLPNLSGSAEFSIVFAPGKVQSVEYVSGEASLKVLIEKIKAAHYQVEFPTGSQAVLMRRAELSCFPLSGCMAVLMPTDKAQIKQGMAQ
jgi:tetratricopeptide (TPR) repeat protein